MSKQKEVIGYGAAIAWDADAQQYHLASKKFKRPGDVRNWIKRTFDSFHSSFEVAEYYNDGTWKIKLLK